MHRFRTGFDLAGKIIDGFCNDPIENRIELGRIAIGQRARFVLVAASLAGHHVSRHGPRAPGKAQHRHPFGQAPTTEAYRLVNRVIARGIGSQPFQCCIDKRRRELGTFARKELQMLADGMRYDEDVGKQDRPVETEPLDGLQGNLAGRLAIIGQGEKTALFGAQSPIFGKVATGLAHEPERDA